MFYQGTFALQVILNDLQYVIAVLLDGTIHFCDHWFEAN